MKKYKYIGTEEGVLKYGSPRPVVNDVYKENDLVAFRVVRDWVRGVYSKEWEEVIEKEVINSFPALSNEKADQMLENRLQLIKQSLLVKAKEYVRNNDRMWNFNQAAKKQIKLERKL